MNSYPDLMDEWPLFGGQLQELLLPAVEDSQRGDGQDGLKQSSGLAKAATLLVTSTMYEDGQLWQFDDIDPLETADTTWLWTDNTLHVKDEQSFAPEFEMMPTLPSSPEMPISQEYYVDAFIGREIGFQDVGQLSNLNVSVVEQLLAPDQQEFDANDPLQNADSVLELLKVLGGNDLSFGQSIKIANVPILPFPQMSPELVESFLSISPASVASSSEDVALLDFPPSVGCYDGGCGSPGSASSCGSVKSNWTEGARSAPYPIDRKKARKMEQNKSAALKYRTKKRDAQGNFMTECEQLQQKNIELKTRVDEITKEINYLKGLMAEMAEYRSDA